ncbi:hypothetical protein EV702DRAFT_1122409 [Suillus placidus]|uniref:Uncharacterized protein n=1 Tax=Suillus placidus TaxID=48579 RepID=A0A9P7CZK8_9AGAM|nr:hypothetical protein EV702DRAFT_1122409 [Suillus placidus]
MKEVGLEDLLSDPKGDKKAPRANATRRPVQRHQPAYRIPQGFFDGVPPDRSHVHSTFLARLFHRNSSDTHDIPPFSPLDWARNLLTRRRQSGEDTELHERRPTVVEVPYAKGKPRNASAGEIRKTKPSRSKKPTASNSRPPKHNVTQQSSTPTQTQPSSQPQTGVSSSSTTPAIAPTATIPTPSRPDVMIRHAGCWTRFWLTLGCLSTEYTDSHH